MDRNTLIGLVLIFGILIGSFYVMKPSEAEIKREQVLQDSIARVKQGLSPATDSVASAKATAPIAIDSAVLKQPFGAAQFGEDKVIVLENEKIIAKISTKGGRVKSVILKNEKNYDGGDLVLFDGDQNKFGLQFNAAGKNIATNDLVFATQDVDISVTGDQSKSLKLRANYSDTQYIEYVYTLKGNDYNVGLAINTVGLQQLIPATAKSINLNWETILFQKEQNIDSERQKSTIYFKDEGVDNLSESSDDEKEVEEKVQWFAFKQHYFSNILMNKDGFKSAKFNVTTSGEDGIVKLYAANAELDFSHQKDNSYSLNFFFGPNKYNILKAEGNDFQKLINMGWGPMRWINQYITVPVFDILDGFHLNYGIVILILTLMLKGILSPLTYKSYLSMAKMRVLKPQLDEIKEKVGDDNAVLLQQEQMKLYKQAGVNPLGGCLPLLLQMPFTIAFFYFFPNLFELRGESFLFMKDMSTYDTLFSFSKLPIIGMDHISLMCILMTLTTLLTTWYNNTTSGATGQMKYIGYFMPLIFFFMLNSFPGGLNYYYFLGAVFTFLQQVIIRKFVDDDKILAKLEANKANPKAQKKSSFQQKMEDMMRQQQQQKK
ncbi:membrane protein insertase YidC [Sphingobacteriaceae bacterium WQ 2009]|uniref:Membrane protein insertase YidC n=1 Tax=Rhinopithecimicrobium faecis TaxID=2820698 RepID=A0A8T4HB73_9SPHI|nr:membrane protein insertase YidC [Sphingobacteriaceae bacterium WQ 2009]